MTAFGSVPARLVRIQPLLFLVSCVLPFQWLNAQENGQLQQASDKETVNYDVPLLVFVPCLNATDVILNEKCDPLIYPAILQAIEDINTNGTVNVNGDEEILLARFSASLIETKNDPFEALNSFFTKNYQKNRNVAGIVGPGSNVVTELMAYVVGASTQAVMVSYGASDSIFSARKDVYSHLFRTIPSEESINKARICLMKKLEWKRIAMATSSSNDNYARVAENLASLAKEIEMDVNLYYIEGLATYTHQVQESLLDTNPRLPGTGFSDVKYVFMDWRRQEYKIIVILLPPFEARTIICKAKRLDDYLLEESHVWILPQYLTDSWWELDSNIISALPYTHNCSNEEIVTIMNHLNILVIDSLKYNIPELHSRIDFDSQFYNLKKDPTSLLHEVLNKARKLNPSSSHLEHVLEYSLAAAAYDSVWALALAYHNIIKRNGSIHQKDIRIEMEELSFRGTAKDHSLGSEQAQDFASIFLVSQFLEGGLQPIYLINNLNEEYFDFCSNVIFTAVNSDVHLPWSNITFLNQSFKWHGGKQPSDGFNVLIGFVPIYGFITAAILNLLSFSICITMLIVMAKFWKNKHIKSMSPKLVLVAMLSCTTVIPSNIIYGLTVSALQYNLSEGLQSFLCTVSSLIFNGGIMVAFTIFLAKSWRIFKIFHNSQHQSKIAGISDIHLGIIIGAILGPYFLAYLIRMSVSDFHDISINRAFVLNSTTLLNLTYCDEQPIGDLLNLLVFMEFGTVTVFLVYLSYKNSGIKDPRFREEGQSIARFGMASLIDFLIIASLFVLNHNYQDHFPRIVDFFWIITIESTVSPVTLFSVVFIPKYVIIYREMRVKKKSNSQLQFNNQLSLYLSSLQAECIQLKKSLKEAPHIYIKQNQLSVSVFSRNQPAKNLVKLYPKDKRIEVLKEKIPQEMTSV